ncbi:MAG: aldehyde dehydrogenase family protein, partial [Planctomycetaceae bacterium]
MLFYLCGSWQQRARQIEVVRPFDGQVLDTVPQATAHDVTLAMESLREGARQMRALTGSERSAILRRAGQLLQDREAELAQVISQEEGKILAEGRLEAARARETLDYSADEARRVCGEMVPLDGAPSGAGRLGFTLRIPCGIVAAITPFNFPLNLVAHKVGPALAGGNAVLLKPASDTPLSALKLVEILLEAGLPPLAIACLTGPGHELGQAICTHPLVRKISFTGSHEIGEAICRMAGVKRVTMELGSNSPVIVLPDAELEQAAKLITASGYSNAGQVCISAQRVLVVRAVYE